MFDKTIHFAFHAVALAVIGLAAPAGIAQFVPETEVAAVQPVQQTKAERVVITGKAIRS